MFLRQAGLANLIQRLNIYLDKLSWWWWFLHLSPGWDDDDNGVDDDDDDNDSHLFIHLSPGLQDWGSLHSSTSWIWPIVTMSACLITFIYDNHSHSVQCEHKPPLPKIHIAITTAHSKCQLSVSPLPPSSLWPSPSPSLILTMQCPFGPASNPAPHANLEQGEVHKNFGT